MPRHLPFLLALAIAPAAMAQFSCSVQESPAAVTISTPRYRITLPREGMAMSVQRDGELLLDFPAVYATPPRPGGQPRSTRMRSFKDAAGVVTLDYEGARTELRPGEYGAVEALFHTGSPGVPAPM